MATKHHAIFFVFGMPLHQGDSRLNA
jgi:hypothetical protein